MQLSLIHIFMLEAMAYYNSEKVVDLYYETTLKLKRLNADDNKAEEMCIRDRFSFLWYAIVYLLIWKGVICDSDM